MLGLAYVANAVATIDRGASDLIAYRIGLSLGVFVIPGLYCLIYGKRKEALHAREAAEQHRRRWDDAP